MNLLNKITLDNSNVNIYPPNETSVATAEVASELIKKGDDVIEIGTGSGFIAIALSLREPLATIIASDINPEVINIAQKNIQNNSANVELIQSNLFSQIKQRKFNLIVSHPPAVPYLATESWGMSPGMTIATNGGEDGSCLIKQLIKEAPKFLKENGKLVLGLPHWTNFKAVLTELENHFESFKIVKTTRAKFFPLTKGHASHRLIDYIKELNKSGIIEIDFSQSPPSSLVSIIVAQKD